MIIIILLFSLSSFGFFAGLLLFFVGFKDISTRFKILLAILLIPIAPFLLQYVIDYASIIPQVSRLIDPNSVEVTGRLSGGAEQFESLTNFSKAWGLGYGNFELNGFVSGINFLRLSFGELGLIFLIALSIILLILNYRVAFYFIFLFFMLFASSFLLTPFLLIAILPLFAKNKSYAK